VDAWDLARQRFEEFVAATSEWAQLAQATIDLRRVTAHEFAHRPELEGLLALLKPAVYPVARDIGDVVYLLAGEVDTSQATVNADANLDHVDRHGDPSWSTGQRWTTDFS
jgi:hypothetical protein